MKKVKLHSGRIAEMFPRTMNTETGRHAWLTREEAIEARLPGARLEKYAFAVSLDGTVERFVNGHGGVVGRVPAPTEV